MARLTIKNPNKDNQVVDETFNEKKIEEIFCESTGKVVFFPVYH